MKRRPFDIIPPIQKDMVMQEYQTLEIAKTKEMGSKRKPTMALRLALSVFGSSPREGFVPMSFFSEEDIQVYIGLPYHLLNRLHLFTQETTARKITDAVFPKNRESGLPSTVRFALAESLPSGLESWLEPVLGSKDRIQQEGWSPPPVYVLNFREGNKAPWIIRSENLCGQVLDGTHRILAYALLGSELPDTTVRVRVFSIHPLALALVNILTIAIRFLMDPFRTPSFLKKRFGSSACFVFDEKLQSSSTDLSILCKKKPV